MVYRTKLQLFEYKRRKTRIYAKIVSNCIFVVFCGKMSFLVLLKNFPFISIFFSLSASVALFRVLFHLQFRNAIAKFRTETVNFRLRWQQRQWIGILSGSTFQCLSQSVTLLLFQIFQWVSFCIINE